MASKFLPRAAVIGLLLGTAAGSTQAVAQQAVAQKGTLASDSSFIQMAASLGLLQERLGKMAQEKGSTPAVRDFGKRMVADYSKVNEELAAAAKQAAYPAPVLLRQHQQVLQRFLSTGGSSFDKKYMAEMVNDHGDAARLYEQESKAGRVASLKALASKLLPSVQQHLQLATQTATSVGADVTATTPGTRQGT
jgi:putative membrane protein